MEMKAGNNVIKRSLTNNTVVADVAASAEELTNPFVKEGFEGKMKFSEFGEASASHSQTPNSNHPTGCIEFGNSSDMGHVEEVHFPNQEAQESEQSNMYVR
ncbi:hypothetical protein DEO72_LG7g610 [Vigna unguiculata]|uniref:Uncharacterized protein n=1 Tax=Vigna unguiculata TaxID=3917 RepID=A0A4D6MD53_VIGUN|nr:hypothetical protein DEO72_LG7g610 [Vigna unguiculata]